MSNKTLFRNFPNQLQERTEDWWKECLDTAVDFVALDYHGIRQSFQNKLRNYNLANDIIDFDTIKKQLVPLYAQDSKYPVEIQHYPIAIQKVNLLVGEEIKRPFNFTARITNDDAISQKEEEKNKMLNEVFVRNLKEGTINEEEFKKQLDEKVEYLNSSYQDKRERLANQLLSYYWHFLDLKELFTRGFEDLLIAGEEIYRVDILGNEPIIRRVNPLTVHIVGGNNSPWVDDAEIIIQDEYWSPSAIIDAYYDELSEDQVKQIEESLSASSTKGQGQSTPGFQATPEWVLVDTTTDTYNWSNENVRNYSRINDNGEIRVVTVRWRGKQRIAIRTYFDEFGDVQQEVVSARYELDEAAGDIELKYLWINEALTGTRIGGDEDDLYLKTQALEVQNRQADNISKCSLGFVGVYANVNNNKAISLVDKLYSIQLAYNMFMNKLNFLYTKYKGPIYRLDFSQMPDDYEPEEWMYYAEMLGWELADPFNEGKKGASLGKVAGSLQQTSGVKDAQLYSIIQQTIEMLNYLEMQAGSISGITKAREGQIQQREAVSNVTREINQSSHITEKWFMLHEQVKRKTLELFLETAKYSFKGKNKKAQYILDDSSMQVLEMDGDLLNEATYGIQILNTNSVQELFQVMKEFGHAAMQTDKATLSDLIDIYTENSIASIKNKLKTSEQKSMDRNDQARQQEIQLKELELQQKQMEKAEENELKLLLQAREIERDVMLKLAELASKEGLTDKELAMEEKLKTLEESNRVMIEKLKAKVAQQKNNAIGQSKTTG